MSLFADEGPRSSPLPPLDFSIRPARDDDLPGAAALSHERSGRAVDAVLRGLRGLVDTGREELLVAEHAGSVCAFAKFGRLEITPDAPANAVPTGWYLTGVVVAPALRRRGIGAALTRARLASIFERGARAHYVANVRNRVSIALHRRLGFRQIQRDVWAPGVRFEGGAGALFAVDRP